MGSKQSVRTAVKVGTATATTYAYDPWGNQVSAVIPTGLPGAGTYAYTWDALGRMLTDAKSGGSTTSFSYIGASFDPVTTKVGTTTTTYAVSPLGPLAQKTGTATTYLVRSLHGDVVGTASAGAVSSPVAYDPWGQVRTGTAGSKLGFQGDPTDGATGMVNMQHRLYVPGLGRFATKDAVFGQVSSPASLNQFIYGGDSPVTMSDPTGMGTVDKNGYVNGTTYNPSTTTSSGGNDAGGSEGNPGGATTPTIHNPPVDVVAYQQLFFTNQYFDVIYRYGATYSGGGPVRVDIEADLNDVMDSAAAGVEASGVMRLDRAGSYARAYGRVGPGGVGFGVETSMKAHGLTTTVNSSVTTEDGYIFHNTDYAVSGPGLGDGTIHGYSGLGIRARPPVGAPGWGTVGVMTLLGAGVIVLAAAAPWALPTVVPLVRPAFA